MARVLGLDFGTRRIGMAISDERGMMAFPYGILDTKGMTKEAVLEYFKKLSAKEEIYKIVLGVPRGLSKMQDTEMTQTVFRFGDELKALGLPIGFVEEYFSSKEAERAPEAPQHIDASAAAIILQSYLDSR